jgi:hypothetical protein
MSRESSPYSVGPRLSCSACFVEIRRRLHLHTVCNVALLEVLPRALLLYSLDCLKREPPLHSPQFDEGLRSKGSYPGSTGWRRGGKAPNPESELPETIGSRFQSYPQPSFQCELIGHEGEQQ